MFDLGISEGVARLVLDRPDARNAIPMTDWSRLADAAEEAGSGGARLLLLSGRGEAFCAGADLKDFALLTEDEGARTRFRVAMRESLDRIRLLPIPTIAIIHGPCFGAGVALVMACDMRIAGEGARFAITPAKLGISYPQEDVHRLISLVGRGQAARLLFGAGSIDGAEAERIGLVELHANSGLEAAVDELTGAILANSAASLAALKRSINLAAEGVAADEEQDRRFDALFGESELGERLEAHRSRRG